MDLSCVRTSVSAAIVLSVLGIASTASADPTTKTRSFMVDLRPGDAGSVRMIDIVASTDPMHPEAPTKVELRVGRVGKAPDQVLKLTVEVSVDAVLASADDVDFNFDGYRDFWLLREAGAKWGRYEAFTFDSKKGQFVKDTLTREIATLDNPEVDEPSKTLISGSIGPSEPYRTVHKFAGGHLVVTESCVFHNGQDTDQDNKNSGLLIIQKIVQGALKIVTQKQISVGLSENPCASGA